MIKRNNTKTVIYSTMALLSSLLVACGGGNSTSSPNTANLSTPSNGETTAVMATPLNIPQSTITQNLVSTTNPSSEVVPNDPTIPLDNTVTANNTLTNSLAVVKPSYISTYNYYVSTTGSDSNSGTQGSPFKTINKAVSLAKPDTTIHIAPGTYYGNVSTNNSGTTTKKITYLSEVKWGAKIIGNGTEATWTNHGNYINIVGFDISGSGRLGILNYGSYSTIANNHVHNMTVSGGCTGNGGAGIVNANYSASDDDIIGNVVHDIGVPGSCNGVQGIYSSNLRGRIFNNIVYRVSAFGIHLWHAANNVIIANNTVFNNGSRNMGGGIVIGTGDSPGGVVLDNTKVVNNIVYNNPSASILEYCYSGQNCIGSHNIIANNTVYGNGSKISLKVGNSSNNFTFDPLFVNYQANGTGDYHLKTTSPAIDKGQSVIGIPTTDLDNKPRVLGQSIDLGAYEIK
jgi:hypothetical protein